MSDLPAYVRALPRRAVSRMVGAAARLPIPRPLRSPLLGLYARSFGVNLDEATRPLAAYGSLAALFTRAIRPDARTWPDDPSVVASPADGKVHAAGAIRRGRTLQVKGVDYGVDELLNDRALADAFEGGSAFTVYLAPGDYHRFHWPFDGVIDRVEHLPGDLWPVHPGAARTLPGLFARNERVVVAGRVASGARFAYVPVGALNVGSIRLTMHPVRTNEGRPAVPRRWTVASIPIRRGEEAGRFEMGSTIVLLLASDGGRLDALDPGRVVRVGDAIGRLT